MSTPKVRSTPNDRRDKASTRMEPTSASRIFHTSDPSAMSRCCPSLRSRRRRAKHNAPPPTPRTHGREFGPNCQSHLDPAREQRIPLSNRCHEEILGGRSGLCLALMLMLGLSFFSALAGPTDASPIVRDWGGTLDPGAQPKKRILVHISPAQDETLSGMIDYPDQNISGILITAITYKAPSLHLESSSSLASYDGTMNKDNSEIAGIFKEGGGTLSPALKRTP
jgi:hypothetical protein